MSEKNIYRKSGYIMALSWPDTFCKQAGAWYDPMLTWFGFNQGGYYKVGHAALVLIDRENRSCHYYDFGRYHAPVGHGRVRDVNTDHDLQIQAVPEFDDNGELLNAEEVLRELYENSACHGEGYLLAGVDEADIRSARNSISKFQSKDFWHYGPAVWNGTNCSRFVCSVLLRSGLSWIKRLRLFFQPTITPSPKGNILAMKSGVYEIGKAQDEDVVGTDSTNLILNR